MSIRRFMSCVGLVAAFVAPAFAASAKGLDYEDLRKVVGVASPAISPDGTRVVYDALNH